MQICANRTQKTLSCRIENLESGERQEKLSV